MERLILIMNLINSISTKEKKLGNMPLLFVLLNFIAIMLALFSVAMLFVIYVIMVNYEIQSAIVLTTIFLLGALIIYSAYVIAIRGIKNISYTKNSVVQEFIQGFIQK
jgi:hypothetical protein